MKLKYIYFILIFGIISACSKEGEGVDTTLTDKSISITAVRNNATTDTIMNDISVLQDTSYVIALFAQLSGKSSQNHWVTFAADSSKFSEYAGLYGDAVLLPASAYYFYKPKCKISAGSSISDSAQINIVAESNLDGYTTYVLPITIKYVDGQIAGSIKEQTLFLVLKTGKPSKLSRDLWTIEAFSSAYFTNTPDQMLDNDNANTFWVSDLMQSMPQWFEINFHQEISFTSLTYYFPLIFDYPSDGGYPTSVKIETSTDGTTWTDKGTFEGAISNNMQKINLGDVSATYLRFTVLSVAKYVNVYDAVIISDIILTP